MASETTVVNIRDLPTPIIVGRDPTGRGWYRLDPGNLMLRCGGCGVWIVYSRTGARNAAAAASR